MTSKKLLVILGHAFVGWALCAATMGVGMATTSMNNTLIIHAIAAPIFFGVVAWNYYSGFGYTSPLITALIFVGFVMATDFFVVALIINRSLDMFTSLVGTWIPFGLIFLATYLVGMQVKRSQLIARPSN
jgi:hypothetical protein